MHETDLKVSGERDGAGGRGGRNCMTLLPCHNIVTIETNKSAAS